MSGTTLAGGPSPSSGTDAASRVADVLLRLAERPGRLGVTQLARDLGLSKPVVHRILRSLASRHLVAPDEGRSYSLGPAAAAVGARALQDLDLRRAALPVLRRLHAQTNETATLSTLIGLVRVYIDQVVSLQEIRMTVELGRPFPLHAGASSKAVLAVALEDLRAQVLDSPLTRFTPRTPVDAAALAAELTTIGRDGVAVSFGERQHGAGSVATAVFGADGEVAGAISLCGPVDRFDAERVARYRPLVREAGREVSAWLRELAAGVDADGDDDGGPWG